MLCCLVLCCGVVLLLGSHRLKPLSLPFFHMLPFFHICSFLSSVKLAQNNFAPNETGSGSSGRGILRLLKIWAFRVLDSSKLALLVLATGCIILFFLQVVSSVRLFPQFEVASARSNPWFCFHELRASFSNFGIEIWSCLHRLAPYLLLRSVRVRVSHHHRTIFDCVSGVSGVWFQCSTVGTLYPTNALLFFHVHQTDNLG